MNVDGLPRPYWLLQRRVLHLHDPVSSHDGAFVPFDADYGELRSALAEKLLEGPPFGSLERDYLSFGERARQDHREVVERRRGAGACQGICPESSNNRLLKGKLSPV
jgi:hypothetical protein